MVTTSLRSVFMIWITWILLRKQVIKQCTLRRSTVFVWSVSAQGPHYCLISSRKSHIIVWSLNSNSLSLISDESDVTIWKLPIIHFGPFIYYIAPLLITPNSQLQVMYWRRAILRLFEDWSLLERWTCLCVILMSRWSS